MARVSQDQTVFDGGSGLALIAGLMTEFAETGDAVAALRWALPLVLDELNAEAGSLFMYRDEDASLECVVCNGPVDVTGLVVTKLDGSARGGVLVSLAERYLLPVHGIGVGEGEDDLRPFEAIAFARSLVGLSK